MLDRNNTDWWRGAVIYQIYPRSFFDTDANGLGDLKGITQKLDEIAALAVDAIWISPFFKSPMEDFGYDVEDFRAVDPLFGTLDDFKTLLQEAHQRQLRILIDLVISHTSEKHAWFVESRQNKTNPKADWYVWADPLDTGAPPNNWLSLFGGTAWEWDTRREQYYLHNFLKSQPDLNFHHPEVQAAVLNEARFWLDLGVDGFRLDVVNFYFHDRALRNNPPLAPGLLTNTVSRSNPYSYQNHLYDKTQPENLIFLERFRDLLEQYPGTAVVGELGVDMDVAKTSAQYTEAGKRLHMVYSFELLSQQISVDYIRKAMMNMESDLGSGWVSWALTNHDFPRVVSRWGYADCAEQAAPMLMALVASLRGSPCIYQGDELGLTEAEVAFEQLQDPYGKAFWPDFKGRDGCRTPIPWRHDAPHAGFTTGTPWLPVAPSHLAQSYDVQMAKPDSTLQKVRRFLWWRRERLALRIGKIRMLEAHEPILAFIRETESERILAVFNLSKVPQSLNLTALDTDSSNSSLLTGHGFSASIKENQLLLPALGVAFLAC